MNHFGSLLVSAMASSMLPLVARAEHPCPVERVAARIVQISPPNSHSTVARDELRLDANVGMCVFFGDRVDAGEGTVDLETPKGRERIGRFQDSRHFDAPPMQAPPVERSVLSILQIIVDRVRDNPRRTQAGVSRGDGACNSTALDSAPARPLRVLKRLPEGLQSIGADVSTVLLAWRKDGANQPIRVRLTDSAGHVLQEQVVCGVGHVALPIAHNLPLGTALTAVADGGSLGRLTWQLRVVDAKGLPTPSMSTGPLPSWALGGWRLESSSSSVRLDAVSRLWSGVTDSLAARWLLDSTLDDLD